MKKIFFTLSFILAAPVYAQDQTCERTYVCYAQSGSHRGGCLYEVAIVRMGDQNRMSHVGCYQTIESAKVGAKSLADAGKCIFLETDN